MMADNIAHSLGITMCTSKNVQLSHKFFYNRRRVFLMGSAFKNKSGHVIARCGTFFQGK